MDISDTAKLNLAIIHLAVNRSEHSQHVSHPPFALSDVLSLYGSPIRMRNDRRIPGSPHGRANNLIKDSPTVRICRTDGGDFIKSSLWMMFSAPCIGCLLDDRLPQRHAGRAQRFGTVLPVGE